MTARNFQKTRHAGKPRDEATPRRPRNRGPWTHRKREPVIHYSAEQIKEWEAANATPADGDATVTAAAPTPVPKQRAKAEVIRPVATPKGLSREAAALYIGVSATKFAELVADGRMPKPRRIDRRRIWDRDELDAAFAELPRDGDADEWEDLIANG